MTSTPMERSLTNNPALPSYHASHLSALEISTFTPSTPPSTANRSTPPERIEREGRDRHLTSNFAGPVGEVTPSVARDHHTHPQVDDRIHFRLFNEYFPTPSTSIADEDAVMDSDQDELQYIDVQEDSQEPEITFDDDDDSIDFDRNSSSRIFDQSEFASRVRQPLIEEDEVIIYDDEDDGESDDGIDQILESRRQNQSETFSFIPDSPSTPSPSILERPQHAQLSPRSASALTSMYSMGRSSWPQPLLNSSITPSLAMSRRSREYENNPHFRPTPRSSTGIQFATSSYFAPFSGEEEEEEDGVSSFQRPTLLQTIRQDIDSSQTYRARGVNRGCGESYSVANIEAMGDVWPLKFDMYYADGGEFNAAHSVENVLKNDTSVYCSRRSTNINICLKLAEPNQSFVLTQFKAKAPTTGFTAPCKEGLIFISHQPIPLETTAYFDNMTCQDYDEYMKFIKDGPRFGKMLEQHGPAADAMVPAAFFQMDGTEDTCTLDFTPNRSGRYVLIKLLRSRCTNSLQRPENIDLQYLGLIGFTGARSFASGSLL
ncbi:hypothetical protein BG006_006853 [Podila minutissima]|uniref:Uncharacterized protein n=1 Tax=Podila minutissima TaxID=64525 RepID=A0A9P5SKK1_9FUNG|nr:hypothetical protein BG006_006853 [Podila minutissima]